MDGFGDIADAAIAMAASAIPFGLHVAEQEARWRLQFASDGAEYAAWIVWIVAAVSFFDIGALHLAVGITYVPSIMTR